MNDNPATISQAFDGSKGMITRAVELLRATGNKRDAEMADAFGNILEQKVDDEIVRDHGGMLTDLIDLTVWG